MADPVTSSGRSGPWTPAGTLELIPHSPAPRIRVFAFASGTVTEKLDVSVDWLRQNREQFSDLWIDVDGLGDLDTLTELGQLFGLHQLSLEDVLTLHQRPKVETYAGYHYIVLRMLSRRDGRIVSEQLSLFLGQNFVLTFQEGMPGDCLEPLRVRLRNNHLSRHERVSSFLSYSIVDSVVDSYFPILESLGETLEALEETIIFGAGEDVMHRIHEIKRELLLMRRAAWPLRDSLGPLLHDASQLVCPETKLFLRDCHDHCVQIIELVETYRELGASLMEVHLSSLSNRMNEVMKMLTVITTIFVPLTFIAGVYGMNFNPGSSPWNMPELNFYWGYPLCLTLMLTLAIGELWFFWRKGWLFQSKTSTSPVSQSEDLYSRK